MKEYPIQGVNCNSLEGIQIYRKACGLPYRPELIISDATLTDQSRVEIQTNGESQYECNGHDKKMNGVGMGQTTNDILMRYNS